MSNFDRAFDEGEGNKEGNKEDWKPIISLKKKTRPRPAPLFRVYTVLSSCGSVMWFSVARQEVNLTTKNY